MNLRMCFGFGWRKTRECEKSSSCLCKDGHVYYVSSRGSSVSRGINELTREHNGRQNAEYLLAYDANATSLLCMTITLPNSSLPMGVVYHSFQSTRLLSYTDIILFLLFESLLVRSSIEYILFFFLQLSAPFRITLRLGQGPTSEARLRNKSSRIQPRRTWLTFTPLRADYSPLSLRPGKE